MKKVFNSRNKAILGTTVKESPMLWFSISFNLTLALLSDGWWALLHGLFFAIAIAVLCNLWYWEGLLYDMENDASRS